jgi:hypothetical protein
MLARLADLGVQADGQLGSPDPLEAIAEAVRGRAFDEVIVATLPKRVSRWLGSDVPQQVERRFGLPVTTVVART